jgi:radical SAM superfamily enzyme YgiQ (UPF0313 family)
MIAFGCVCPTVSMCEQLAIRIKEIRNDVTVAIGGSHINSSYRLTKEKHTKFDKYVKGYDIEAVCNMLERDEKIVLSDIEYVDYSLLPNPLCDYDINLFSTLGCPFNCFYCQDKRIPYFENSLDGSINSIKTQIPAYKLVHFFDSSLGYDMKRLLQVCKCLENARHSFVLSCDLRAEMITPESVKALERAGFREIRIGLETADDDVLLKNNRNLSVKSVLDKFKIVREFTNIYLTVYSVSGLSHTTTKSFDKTLELFQILLRTRIVDEIKNAQYVPYPIDGLDFSGMGIYIDEDNWEKYDRQSYPVYHTSNLSREQIWKGFLETAKVINTSWLNGNGFYTIDELCDVDIYPEYIVGNYLESEKKQNEKNEFCHN